ncbi:MAG TPA: hypothetical protein VGG39_05855 [Polyangiaceae bacterium]|jgi:hypothetical protein
MKTIWTIAGAVTVLGAIVACSGSTGSAGGAGGGTYDSCLSSLLGSACIACVNSNCGGALGDMETGCSDYFGCICPGGNFSAPNAESQTCASKLEESSCASTGGGNLVSCAACDSACSAGTGSSGGGGFGLSDGTADGGGSGSSSGSFGGASGGSSSGCGDSLLPGTRAITLSLTGVDFGDSTSAAWKGIGFNLDGKCTTASSTDTCGLEAGAPASTQDDGANGIDDSYGENICPIWETLAGSGACSTLFKEVVLQTDAGGNGTLVLASGANVLALPVADVHVAMNGSAGMAGGVMPTAGLAAAVQKQAACISTSLCSESSVQALVTQFVLASDIAADGSNTPGPACDGVSFGIRFAGSTPVTSVPTQSACPCP